MNLKTSTFALFLFIFVSSCSFAQYKYDIGLKVSSYDTERFQFDARYHFKSPISLLVNLSSGKQSNSFYSRTPVYDDSLMNISSGYSSERNYSIKAGVQRKIGFFKTDVFYGGVSLGGSHNEYRGHFSSGTYVTDSIGSYPFYLFSNDNLGLPDETNIYRKTLSLELTASFGMDVPVSDRFSINAELGLGTAYRHSLTYGDSFFTQQFYVSGGLRYSFGSRN